MLAVLGSRLEAGCPALKPERNEGLSLSYAVYVGVVLVISLREGIAYRLRRYWIEVQAGPRIPAVAVEASGEPAPLAISNRKVLRRADGFAVNEFSR